MNTVILITNQEEIKQRLQENLVLLRETDKLLVSNYENAPDALYELRPDIVILHENENREKTLNTIKYIKEKKIFANSHILLLTKEYDREFILAAYDEGIDDYITLKSDPSEILIRTINCIKKSEMFSKLKLYESNLKTYGILEAKSGFYTSKAENNILDIRLHMDNHNGYSYMIITPDEEGKKNFSSDSMISSIKKATRSGDIITSMSGAKYSILLQCGIDGAIKVLEKIKLNLPQNFTIKAGIVIIDTEQFEEVKKKAICALNNALLQNKDYIVYSGDINQEDDWLVQEKEAEKTYKFFKKAFSKKIENVIAPVFYRAQKTYEERINEAKIEQFTDEQQSVFRIICGTNESRLTMRYPGFAKLIIYISHSGIDSPENREITLPINQITETKIDEILDSFINEFTGIYRHLYKSGEC